MNRLKSKSQNAQEFLNKFYDEHPVESAAIITGGAPTALMGFFSTLAHLSGAKSSSSVAVEIAGLVLTGCIVGGAAALVEYGKQRVKKNNAVKVDLQHNH